MNEEKSELEFVEELFDELWPIMRSITGPGIERSMEIFQRYMPLEITKVPTGTRVFDWVVPQEWHFESAQLIGPNGEVVCDAADNNLHVVNYSEPVHLNLSLEELQSHLHSIPEYPDAIPYVTSYYKRNWGFCLSQRKRDALIPGTYEVKIVSSFRDGGVPIAECVLPGRSKKEVLLSSYLCHPSMANNELSGPLVLLLLYKRLKNWRKRRFTYRFLLNPETIGSLCFLHLHKETVKANTLSGLVLTCLGGPNKSLNFKSSRRNTALINHVVEYLEKRGDLNVRKNPFTPIEGSDERQFCSPGFNLPIGQMSRTTYDTYAGYHNSMDSKPFMRIDTLVDSANRIAKLLEFVEYCGNPVSLFPHGEPQLGRRELYPSINSNVTRTGASSDGVADGRTQLNRMLVVLNMADGRNSLIEMAQVAGCKVEDLFVAVDTLEEKGLIDYDAEPLND